LHHVDCKVVKIPNATYVPVKYHPGNPVNFNGPTHPSSKSEGFSLFSV